MIFEDMDPIKIEEIKTYLKTKKALIIDSKKTTRTTLKKILSNFGIVIQNIYIADNVSDAQEIIKELGIQIVFCAYEIKGKNGIDVLETHIKVHPNRQNTVFTLISGPNSIAASCLVLDSEADDYIAEPFTAKSISESFLKTLERKLNRTNFLNTYHLIKEHIFTDNLEEARRTLEPLKDGVDNLDEVFYLEGKILHKEGNLEGAIPLYEQALEVNHTHYCALSTLIDEYSNLRKWDKAYTHTLKFLKLYPINPERLPKLIRLSIANQKYEDLINYADFFKSLEVQSPQLKTIIAASLVICSKYFLKSNEHQKGIKTLLEAIKFSSGKMSILENIISTFIEYKEVRLAYEVLKQFEELHGDSPLYKTLEVEIDYCNKDTKSVLIKGIPLAESGVANFKVYEAVIISSIKARRKTNSIIHLIDKAIAKYPDSSKYFQAMYKE